MNSTMMKFAFAATVSVGAGVAFAQDMGGTPAASSASVVKPVVPAPALETPQDKGPVLALEAQKDVPAVAAPAARNARAFVQEKISKKYVIGYDADRGSIIQIGFAQAPVGDPAKSANFIEVRDMLAREAMLNARMQIAKLVRQKVSAMNKVSMLGTRENAEYSKKYAEQIAAAAQQQEKVKALLAQLESAEANRLEGVTVGDRWNALMDGIIARIDAKYDKGQVAAEKRKQYEAVKVAYETAKAQLDDLRQKAEAMCPPIGENESEMSAQASFKLLGTHVLLQSESYDGMNYQVAVAVVWSPKLQERAVKTLGFAENEVGKPGDSSLGEWLKANEKSLASMVGTRQFTDDKGRRYVLGISACLVSDDVNMQQQDMERADLFAQQAVMFGLFSEGMSDQVAKGTMSKYKGNNPNDTKASYAKSLFESVPKDTPISGLGKCFDTQVKHPISNREIYVSVACVDSVLAARSTSILRSMYAAATEAAVTANYYRGEEQGLKDVYNAARKDPSAYEAGRQSGAAGLVDELKAREKVHGGVTAQPVAVPSAGADKAPAKSQKGIFTGDSGINDDF